MSENNFQIYSASVTDRGLSEKRPQNEDSFLEMKHLGLFSVADGVGGAQAGDVASQMAMEILGEAFVNLQSNGDAEDMMKIAIERANGAIYQMSSDLPQLSMMATTIVALHISGNIATIGHVGDSRLYRLDANGSLFRETQDHSVVEEEVRAGRMTVAQAANHPSRNVISRALGAESTVEVDMKTIMFDGDTKFLLCSDGITRHINDFEIRDLLLANEAPAEICQKMKDICYSRGAEDNLTAVIVSVVGAGQEESAGFPASTAAIDDEATVATARQAVSVQPTANGEESHDEIPTRALEMPASVQISPETDSVAPTENFSREPDDDESYLIPEPVNEAPQPAPETLETSKAAAVSAGAANEVPPVARQEIVETRQSSTTYEPEEKSGGGFFGKLLSALIWLIVGAILGVGGYYYWLTMTAKPAEVPPLKMESANPPFTTFEKAKREVDANPVRAIETYEKSTPKDAADFYLLGRAYVLNKRYDDARNSLIEARNKLSEYAETANKEVLTSDINAFLVIAQDKTAQAAFERERKVLSGGEPFNQANTNQ